jgi:uncharacterized double-CXXCG motif protein
MRYFLVEEVRAPGHSGRCKATHPWKLPGVHCPLCSAIWSAGAGDYPSVDLSLLPDQQKYSARLEQDYSEFERLREQVRPLVPLGAVLWPGTSFGPLTGTARGEFGPFFVYYPWLLLMRGEAVERLRAEGVRGLRGCRTALRFRQKNPPELLEMELLPMGRLHGDCLPPDQPPPCPKCGRDGLALPDEPILEASSLPTDVDLFRLGNFLTLIIATEHFVEASRRLGYEQDIVFRELPVRA